MGFESHFILMGMSAQHKPMPSAIPEARWGPICTPSPGFFRSYPASSRSPDILQTPVMFSICQSNLVWGLILAEPASKEQDEAENFACDYSNSVAMWIQHS